MPCRHPELVLDVFLGHVPPYFLKQGLTGTCSSPVQLDLLASKLLSTPVFTPLVWWLQAGTTVLCFYVGAESRTLVAWQVLCPLSISPSLSIVTSLHVHLNTKFQIHLETEFLLELYCPLW